MGVIFRWTAGHADIAGAPKGALEYQTRAAEDHQIDHYMQHVARLHRDRLREKGLKWRVSAAGGRGSDEGGGPRRVAW